MLGERHCTLFVLSVTRGLRFGRVLRAGTDSHGEHDARPGVVDARHGQPGNAAPGTAHTHGTGCCHSPLARGLLWRVPTHSAHSAVGMAVGHCPWHEHMSTVQLHLAARRDWGSFLAT